MDANQYQMEAVKTCSPNFYGKNFPLDAYMDILQDAVHSGNELDLYKRSLFYDNREKYDLSDPDAAGFNLVAPSDIDVVHGVTGLITESGELAESLIKALENLDDNDSLDLDTVNCAEELGDILWYVAVAARGLGYSMSDLMEMNVSKLAKRFAGQKFTAEQAINRDHDKERIILEKG